MSDAAGSRPEPPAHEWPVYPAGGPSRSTWEPPRSAPYPSSGAPARELSPSQVRTWSVWSHLAPLLIAGGGVLLSAGTLSIVAFVFPLVVMTTLGHRSLEVRAHAVESLNYQLSWLLYSLVGAVVAVGLVLATLGLALLIVVPVWLVALVLYVVWGVRACLAADRGTSYRYPLTIRFVR